MSGLIYELAADLWRTMKDDYAERLEQVFTQAHEDCNGYLVNKIGRAEHVSAFSLFSGSEAKAYRYASRELVAWWAEHGRLTLTAYESQWLNGRGLETAYDEQWGART